MKSMISVLVLFCILLPGCGAVSVNGSFDAGAAGTSTVSGTVSLVRLTFANDGKGNSITVTVVTLLQRHDAQDLTFCGTQVSQFPINAFVTVNYTSGVTCSTVNSVSVAR
jgi:hypothetical protein